MYSVFSQWPRHLRLCVAAIFILFFTACKKDKEIVPQPGAIYYKGQITLNDADQSVKPIALLKRDNRLARLYELQTGATDTAAAHKTDGSWSLEEQFSASFFQEGDIISFQGELSADQKNIHGNYSAPGKTGNFTLTKQ